MDKAYVLTGYYPTEDTQVRVLAVISDEIEANTTLNELMDTYLQTKIKDGETIDMKVREDCNQVTFKKDGKVIVEYEIHERTIL